MNIVKLQMIINCLILFYNPYGFSDDNYYNFNKKNIPETIYKHEVYPISSNKDIMHKKETLPIGNNKNVMYKKEILPISNNKNVVYDHKISPIIDNNKILEHNEKNNQRSIYEQKVLPITSDLLKKGKVFIINVKDVKRGNANTAILLNKNYFNMNNLKINNQASNKNDNSSNIIPEEATEYYKLIIIPRKNKKTFKKLLNENKKKIKKLTQNKLIDNQNNSNLNSNKKYIKEELNNTSIEYTCDTSNNISNNTQENICNISKMDDDVLAEFRLNQFLQDANNNASNDNINKDNNKDTYDWREDYWSDKTLYMVFDPLIQEKIDRLNRIHEKFCPIDYRLEKA